MDHNGANKTISIVIPALNEEEGIQVTMKAIPRAELETMGYQVQVLVVDNNSEDATAELARKAGADVVLEERRGYGRAYKTGFACAKGDIILTADADDTYPIEDFTKLVEILEKENLDFRDALGLLAPPSARLRGGVVLPHSGPELERRPGGDRDRRPAPRLPGAGGRDRPGGGGGIRRPSRLGRPWRQEASRGPGRRPHAAGGRLRRARLADRRPPGRLSQPDLHLAGGRARRSGGRFPQGPAGVRRSPIATA